MHLSIQRLDMYVVGSGLTLALYVSCVLGAKTRNQSNLSVLNAGVQIFVEHWGGGDEPRSPFFFR